MPGMEIEEDDLPAGYPSMWELVSAHLETWGAVAGKYSTKVGVSRRDPTDDPELNEQKRQAARDSYRKFYTRRKDDPAWVAQRRAYYRARYRQGKDK